VLLVDADMRNPRVAQRFGLDVPEGLAEHLAGDQAVHRYLQEVGVPHLMLLGAGSVPPNPAELLATPRARILWRELRQTADLIIVDTPPLLPVADTLEVVGDADHVVLVVRDRESRLRHLRAAIDLLRQVSCPFSGLVLNGLPGKEVPYRYASDYKPRLADTAR
jgi:non-specific protein-tyrosine kinase